MVDSIVRTYKRNHIFKYLTIALLLFSAIFFASSAFSTTSDERFIKLEGEEPWKMSQDFEEEWFVNAEEKISFEVDLSDDYERLVESLPKEEEGEGTEPEPEPEPGSDDGTNGEEETEPDPEGDTDGDENGNTDDGTKSDDDANQENELDSETLTVTTNGDGNGEIPEAGSDGDLGEPENQNESNEPGEDENNEQDKTEPTEPTEPEQPELPIDLDELTEPFTIAVSFEDGTIVDAVEISKVEDEERGFTGVFNVEFLIPEDEEKSYNGQFEIALSFIEDNEWGIEFPENIPENTFDFHITRDTILPEIEIAGVPDDTSTSDVEIKTTITEENIEEVRIYRHLLKEGEEKTLIEESDKKKSYSHDFEENGTYEITVVVVDKAGNEQTATTTFAILKGEHEFPLFITNKDNNEDLSQGDATASDNLELYINNYIAMSSIDLTVTKVAAETGEIETSKEVVAVNGNHTDYRRLLGRYIDDEGEYTISVTTTGRHRNAGTQEFEDFSFSYDTTAPELQILKEDGTDLSDEEQFEEPLELTFNVIDENYDQQATELKIQLETLEGSEEFTPEFDESGTATFTANEDGVYTIEFSSTDRAGNSSEEELSFSLDQSPPEVDWNFEEREFFNDPDGKTVTITIRGILVDFGTHEFQVTKDGEPYDADFARSRSLFKVEYEYTFEEEGDYEIIADIRSVFGKEETVTKSFILDTTPPSIVVEGSINDGDIVQSGDVDITIADKYLDEYEITVYQNGEPTDAGDAGSDLLVNGESIHHALSFNDGEGLYDEYKIVIEATDKAGNHATEEMEFIIDTTNPEISINGVERGVYYSEPQSIEFVFEDDTLDLGQTILEITKDDDDAIYLTLDDLEKLDGESVDGKKGTYRTPADLAEGKYQIVAESIDLAGNKTSIKDFTFYVDMTPPVIEFTGVNDGAIVQDGAVHLHVTDEPFATNAHYDVYKVEYAVYKNGEKLEDRSNTYENRTWESDYPIVFNEEEARDLDDHYEIVVNAWDEAGNHAEESIALTIDSTNPEIEIGGVEEDAHYKESDDRTATITFTDENLDLDQTTIVVYKDGNEEPYQTLDEGHFELTSESGEGTVLVFENKEPFVQGEYTIVVNTTDRAGNEAEEKAVSFTVDFTPPTINLPGSISNGDYLQSGDLTVRVNDNYAVHRVRVTETKNGTATVLHDGAWDGNLELLYNEAARRNLDDDYEIKVEAWDRAGNKTERTRSFTIDTTNPSISLPSRGDKTYHRSSRTVNVSVDERNMEELRVTVNRKDPVTERVLETWTFRENERAWSHEFVDEYLYTIDVRATDKAGNRTTASTTLVIDKTDPMLSINNVTSDEHYKSRTATIRVQDTTIDLDRTTLRVQREWNGTKRNYSVDPLTLKNATTAETEIRFTQEGIYYIDLTSTDKAGNRTTHETVFFYIDNTEPVLSIDGVEENSYNPTDMRVSVSVEELNYEWNDVELIVTKDNQPYNMGTWRNTGLISRLAHNFTQDGEYRISITAEDKAGNGPVSLSRVFTIDKIDPDITITGVENEEYYNEDRPVNVTIQDTNLDINNITVTRDGASYNAGGFAVSGDLATLNHNFSAEGYYEIFVEAIDKAGNRSEQRIAFTIDKTPPVITPMFSGEDRVIVDGEYINRIFTPNFVLDEADDSITSVRLNGQDVTGRIPTASTDMEYHFEVRAVDFAGNETTLEIFFTLDTTMPELDISGIVDGYFNESITPTITYYDLNIDESRTRVTLNGQPFESGTVLEYEQDYVLEAVVTDLADNVTSRTIVFTIDKTAPTISFLEPINDRYFNYSLIPEFLIESLSPYDIIAITLNGNTYNIGDPIEEEGKHVLFFEVMDSAGNIQQLSVEFIIDLTPPEVIYSGVEDQGTYFETVNLELRLDDPMDKINSVMINGELFSGDVLDVDGYETIRTTLSEIGVYEVIVEASDEAGNESTFALSFEIAEKGLFTKYYENTLLFGGSIALVLTSLIAGTTVYARRRKHGKKAEEVELEE
ncbi:MULTISPECIES: Ig-like domain-containing protein [Bacillaceae]|uniref:Ig-like domain repeat protein n=1 Tax=Evansella alkalicola TaxID=745819 RepID=A0ABS6K092_9BACI|nr:MULTISPECIES: Ig-like domain-containing protein [Bacillaceae]MBU9724265.1 Ig-like domain repeat protein [Bacillus alkalicola]